MHPLRKIIFLLPPLFALIGILSLPAQVSAQQDLVSPTPTYNPLAEPPLPPNPNEYELGRNLYWHWCMTCHGDRGQGLTDSFRAIWVPDHQNCWARGCHTGRVGDTGFPIPTVVPALVDENHLARFSSLQSLADFLKATHPPQSPGILTDKEYHAIALFVFAMNDREPDQSSSVATPASTPTGTSVPVGESSASSVFTPIGMIALIVLIVIFILLIRRAFIRQVHES
ncbi:MAG TPA: hypothetical protein VMT73_15050 [Anaerolineales bacterium]|nr:hypothetical protein [Anaerolineales bacterium]